jgi:hypothetical protein
MAFEWSVHRLAEAGDFASKALAGNSRCWTLDKDVAWAISDHCPVIVELDVEGPSV